MMCVAAVAIVVRLICARHHSGAVGSGTQVCGVRNIRFGLQKQSIGEGKKWTNFWISVVR